MNPVITSFAFKVGVTFAPFMNPMPAISVLDAPTAEPKYQLSEVVDWAVDFPKEYYPLNKKSGYPGNDETPEARGARYVSIETDVLNVVFNPKRKSLFTGPQGRLFEVALINSLMSHEGGFRLDVDTGKGKFADGDKGASVCLMQINIGNNTIVVDGEKWTRHDLHNDRTKCIRAGLQKITDSIAMCGKLNPKKHWLAGYTSGACNGKGPDGLLKSEQRWDRAIQWMSKHKPSFTDADVLEAFDKTSTKVVLSTSKDS